MRSIGQVSPARSLYLDALAECVTYQCFLLESSLRWRWEYGWKVLSFVTLVFLTVEVFEILNRERTLCVCVCVCVCGKDTLKKFSDLERLTD